jgi:hypothetical protein
MRKKESATFSANPGIGQTNLKLGGSHEYIYICIQSDYCDSELHNQFGWFPKVKNNES